MVGIDKWNRLRAQIAAKVAALEPDAAEKLNEEMAISFEEHFRFQQEQVSAHSRGLITTEVAQQVYSALGEVGSTTNGGWAKDTDLATKCLITQFMGELLSLKLAARS